MDTTTMTNTEETTIFDEIVNYGILEEDSVVNFGAGHQGGIFLKTLRDYNGVLSDKVIGVEPDPKRIKLLTKLFANDDVQLLETPLQSYIDSEPETVDWVVITGLLNNPIFGENQHAYVSTVVRESYGIVNKGVMFHIKENASDDFKFAPIYFLVDFANTYDRFTIKKIGEDNYVFCIFKQ